MAKKTDEEVLFGIIESATNQLNEISDKLGDEEKQLGKLAGQLDDDKKTETMQRQIAIGELKKDVADVGSKTISPLKSSLASYINRINRLTESLEKVK